jgi:hypothetical protein
MIIVSHVCDDCQDHEGKAVVGADHRFRCRKCWIKNQARQGKTEAFPLEVEQ